MHSRNLLRRRGAVEQKAPFERLLPVIADVRPARAGRLQSVSEETFAEQRRAAADGRQCELASFADS